MTRTPLHVFGLQIFAEGLVLVFVGIVAANWYGSRQSRTDASLSKVFLAVAYLMSAVFSFVGLSPVAQLPAWPMAVFVPMGALGLIIFIVSNLQGDLVNPPDIPPDDPSQPPLFVQKELSVGYTLNMDHPWAWRLVTATILWIALLVSFLLWSQR